MSKVKGNVIDPLDLVHGADVRRDASRRRCPARRRPRRSRSSRRRIRRRRRWAPASRRSAPTRVRFTLATYPPSNKRIALAPEAHRGQPPLPQQDLERDAPRARPPRRRRHVAGATPPRRDGFYNRWILSRFAAACAAAHDGLDAFRIDEAALAALPLLLERPLRLVPRARRSRSCASSRTAPSCTRRSCPRRGRRSRTCSRASLRLLHPLMPFITEELWQRVPRPASRKASVAFGPFPTQDDERASLDAGDRRVDGAAQGGHLGGAHDPQRARPRQEGRDPARACARRSPEVLAFLRGHAEAIALAREDAGRAGVRGARRTARARDDREHRAERARARSRCSCPSRAS